MGFSGSIFSLGRGLVFGMLERMGVVVGEHCDRVGEEAGVGSGNGKGGDVRGVDVAEVGVLVGDQRRLVR